MILRPENNPGEWQPIKSWFAKDSLHEVYLSKNEFVTITVIKWHDDDCYKIIDLEDGVESVLTKQIEDRYFY
jgi:hypothetical protein